ncbi:MAG: hypothetical protein JST00_27885 [Deltaproteobacteria bacterium]|nr:hypothetical protein [Deltaproteobacteria bacterium]
MNRIPVLSVAGELGDFIVDESTNRSMRVGEAAKRLLALVDGERTEGEIAASFATGGAEHPESLLPRCRAFLDRCAEFGIVGWKGDEEPIVSFRPRRRLA